MSQGWIESLLSPIGADLEEDREWARNTLPHLPLLPYPSRAFLESGSSLRTMEALLEEKTIDFLTIYRESKKSIIRLRAARSPTRLLPNEILTEIFSFIPNTFRAQDLSQGARLVCRRWNTVVISSPHLWTNILLDVKSRDPDALPRRIVNMMPIWLSRSSTLPLNVEVNFSNGNPRSDGFWAQCKNFLDSLPRWASLTFSGHPLDFGWILNELSDPLRLEELSYRTFHNRFTFPDDDRYRYINGRKVMFHAMRKLEIFASSHSHPIRFVGPKVTTLSFGGNEMALHVNDYLAMSQDTPNVQCLTFGSVVWGGNGDSSEVLAANAFGHCKLVELSWKNSTAYPSLIYQFAGDKIEGNLALTVIFGCITSQSTGIRTLAISWRLLKLELPPQLGALEDLHITAMNGYSTDDLPVFRAWVTQCCALKKLEINFERSPCKRDTTLIRALYDDETPGIPILINPRLQKIDLRDCILHVSALWGLHHACRSTIPIHDHFLHPISESIDWPRDEDGNLHDLSEALEREVYPKLLRFVVTHPDEI